MSSENLDLGSADHRRTLWLVLLLNVFLAAAFFGTGLAADSSALIANGLDNSSDAVVYVISLVALSRPPSWKRTAARVSGILLLLFAGGILYDVWRRFQEGTEPLGGTMLIMAVVAALVNYICLRLLQRLTAPDVTLRAARTFSANDFIANAGILVAGALVLWTGKAWPDLVVGLAVAGIAAWGGVDILRDAQNDNDVARLPQEEK